MDEIAEFIGGDMDGRTVVMTDPPSRTIRIPVSRNFPLVVEKTALTAPKPSFEIDDYHLIGRNDAGHLRYMKGR